MFGVDYQSSVRQINSTGGGWTGEGLERKYTRQ